MSKYEVCASCEVVPTAPLHRLGALAIGKSPFRFSECYRIHFLPRVCGTHRTCGRLNGAAWPSGLQLNKRFDRKAGKTRPSGIHSDPTTSGLWLSPINTEHAFVKPGCMSGCSMGAHVLGGLRQTEALPILRNLVARW